MPAQDKFYDYTEEIPDYDFFSPNAQSDAMALADIFFKAGYKDTQARSGVHEGKIFVLLIQRNVQGVGQLYPAC